MPMKGLVIPFLLPKEKEQQNKLAAMCYEYFDCAQY